MTWVDLLVISIISAGWWGWARLQFERGLHLGVSDPHRACELLNRRGYDMRYRFKENGGDL